MLCPNCAALQVPQSSLCLKCGAPVSKALPRKRCVGSQLGRGVFFAFLGIGGFICLLMVIGLVAHQGARIKD